MDRFRTKGASTCGFTLVQRGCARARLWLPHPVAVVRTSPHRNPASPPQTPGRLALLFAARRRRRSLERTDAPIPGAFSLRVRLPH